MLKINIKQREKKRLQTEGIEMFGSAPRDINNSIISFWFFSTAHIIAVLPHYQTILQIIINDKLMK